MRNISVLFLTLGAGVFGQTPSANPLTHGATLHYGIIKGYVTRAAVKMLRTTRSGRHLRFVHSRS